MPSNMPNFGGVLWISVWIGISATTGLAQSDFDSLEGDAWTKAHADAAERHFKEWKETGTISADFLHHVQAGERADLLDRFNTGDKLESTEIRSELPVTEIEVKVLDRSPIATEHPLQGALTTVWRRITRDRFEIWRPDEGRLFDAAGTKIATAKVKRGDGWGREWYGAFLPDGRWVTTDLDEYDRRLTMFSAKGKRIWSLRSNQLLPSPDDPDETLIAWSRSDKKGEAWIVSVGSEEGRGWVSVKPDGKARIISSPWTECFPQQLGQRGMYTGRKVMSDDGTLTIQHSEAGHGIGVGWPNYEFPGERFVTIPNGFRMGILPAAKSVYIESGAYSIVTQEDERLWLFNAKGDYQHWIRGRKAGSGVLSKTLWIRSPDGKAWGIDEKFSVTARRSFLTESKEQLIPVELHDDINLGLFMKDEHLLLGRWKEP